MELMESGNFTGTTPLTTFPPKFCLNFPDGSVNSYNKNNKTILHIYTYIIELFML